MHRPGEELLGGRVLEALRELEMFREPLSAVMEILQTHT